MIYFYYLVIISPWKRAFPFIWTNMNPLHQRMFCGKFGWNKPSVSGEDENVKSLQTEWRTDRRTPEDHAVKFTWTFSYDELKILPKPCQNCYYYSIFLIFSSTNIGNVRRSVKFTWTFSYGERKILLNHFKIATINPFFYFFFIQYWEHRTVYFFKNAFERKFISKICTRVFTCFLTCTYPMVEFFRLFQYAV